MASNQDYLLYVLDLLREIPDITHKKMMGEYILYQDGIIFGGVYDNRFLVKITPASKAYGFKEEIPYPGGKSMLLVDIEETSAIHDLVLGIVNDLKQT